MKFAVRREGRQETMIEFEDYKSLLGENQRIQDEGGAPLTILFEDDAKAWVRDGKQHETGLWLDGDVVRYAEAEQEA